MPDGGLIKDATKRVSRIIGIADEDMISINIDRIAKNFKILYNNQVELEERCDKQDRNIKKMFEKIKQQDKQIKVLTNDS